MTDAERIKFLEERLAVSEQEKQAILKNCFNLMVDNNKNETGRIVDAIHKFFKREIDLLSDEPEDGGLYSDMDNVDIALDINKRLCDFIRGEFIKL